MLFVGLLFKKMEMWNTDILNFDFDFYLDFFLLNLDILQV